MAPDISKVDSDRRPDPAAAAWNLRDEVLRWFFHGHRLSDPRNLLIPFFGKLARLMPLVAGVLTFLPTVREVRFQKQAGFAA